MVLNPTVDFDVNVDGNPKRVTVHNVNIEDIVWVDYIPTESSYPEGEGIYKVSADGGPGVEDFIINATPDFTFEVAYTPKEQNQALGEPWNIPAGDWDQRSPVDWTVKQRQYGGEGVVAFDGRTQAQGGDVLPGTDLDVMYDAHSKTKIKRERFVGGTRQTRNSIGYAKAQMTSKIDDVTNVNGVYDDIKAAGGGSPWSGLWGTFSGIEKLWVNLQLDIGIGVTIPELKFQIRGLELSLYDFRIEDEKLRKVMQHSMDKVQEGVTGLITNAGADQFVTVPMTAESGKVVIPSNVIKIKPGTGTVLHNGNPLAPEQYTLDNENGEILSVLFNPGDTVQVEDYNPDEAYSEFGENMAQDPAAGTEFLTLKDNFVIDIGTPEET